MIYSFDIQYSLFDILQFKRIDRFASLQAPPFKAELREAISRIGAFFSRQDAGLPPARPNNGNCLIICCLQITTITFPRTDTEVCLLKTPGRSSCREKNAPIPEMFIFLTGKPRPLGRGASQVAPWLYPDKVSRLFYFR